MIKPGLANPAHPRAFTLIEMLAVILLILILMALMIPAVNGLLGISGPRGGLNSLTAAIDQARLSAMENDTPVYLAFPTGSTNPENTLSYMIICRSRKPNEKNLFTPITRWIPLPRGVFVESDDLVDLKVEEQNLPPLDGETITDLKAIAFDCLGKLLGTSQQSRVKIGEKETPDGEFIGKAQSHYELVLEPLTGRASVSSVTKPIQ